MELKLLYAFSSLQPICSSSYLKSSKRNDSNTKKQNRFLEKSNKTVELNKWCISETQKEESQSEKGEVGRIRKQRTAAGKIQSWSFVRGRITSFYDPEALLFLGRRRRDLTLTSQHSPVFVFTAASTPRLQPPLLWIHAVCRAWG